MPDPLSTPELEYFVGLLENPSASDNLKAMAEHLVSLYFNEGAVAAGEEWLRLRARDNINAFSEYVFGYKPAAHHREITRVLDDPRRKRTVVVAHPQCFSIEDSRILKADGTEVSFSGLAEGDIVSGIDPDTLKLTSSRVSNVFLSGKKECLRVTTKSGYTVTVSHDHRMFTFDGWKPAGKLSVGDHLTPPTQLPHGVEDTLRPEEVRLLAYWIAEGCRSTKQNAFIVSTASADMADEIAKDAATLGWGSTKKFVRGKLVGIHVLRGSSGKHPASLLLEHGLDPKTCGAHDKFIPDSVKRLDKPLAALFLNRLFACDGCFTTKKGTGSVDYSTASRTLLDDVRTMLLRFGVVSRVRQCNNTDGTGSGKVFTSWRLHVNDGPSVFAFMDSVGMFTKDQRFSPEVRASTGSAPFQALHCMIPSGWRSLMQKSAHHYRVAHNLHIGKPGSTQRTKVSRVADLERNEELTKLCESEVWWDEISSIEPVGLRETGDIEVEGIHNFFLNGVVSHNSAKSTYVSLIYPTYLMGKLPDHSTIMLGEAFSQMEKYNSQIRPIIQGKNETGQRFLSVFPEATPDEDQGWTREKLYLANRTRPIKDPNLFFSGAGSSAIQGSRANVILLDDIVGPDKIRSPTEMAKVRDDLHNLIVPRLHPDGRIICVMTRWAANDLAETFLQEMDFEMVYMPAISDDPRGAFIEFIPSKAHLRYPQPGEKSEVPQWVRHHDPEAHVRQQLEEVKAEAEAEGYRAEISTSAPNYDLPCVRKFLHADNDPVLWPQLFTKEALEQKRQAKPISFRLVYNGDPTGVSGDVFKREWFHTYGGEDDTFKRVPLDCRYFMSVDVAVGGSRKGRGDYFVVMVVAVDAYGNKFIVDLLRSNTLLPPYQPRAIEKMFEKYPETMACLIETTNYQAALFHALADKGLPVLSYKPIKNKDLRIEASSVFWQQGKIFLPFAAAWKNDFIDEHTEYPRGKHDDQIDAGAQLWEFLAAHSSMPAEMQINFG